MSKASLVSASCLASLVLSGSAVASDVDAMLNAPGWDLAYEVTFKASDSGSSKSLHGSTTYTMSIEWAHSATLALDMRNAGASLSMVRLASTVDPTSSNMQEKAMELVMRTDVMANWMSAGVQFEEDATDDEQMQATLAYMESSKGRGSLDYTMVVKGDDLVTEMGTEYDMVSTTTRKGSGPIHGSTQLTFEMDAKAKTYLVTLATDFSDKSDSTVIEDVVTVSSSKGGPPTEERSRNYRGLDDFPSGFTIDDSTSTMGAIPLFAGTFDPSLGKITGERRVRGHYSDLGTDVRGTFVFRWTLTPRE